jgi:hypothetical protein
MKWVKDNKGRFPERPHYEIEELDSECERIVEGFLMSRYGKIEYPVLTEDLLLMLEKETESVDPYAHFEEDDLWGETTFVSGRKPKVRISSALSENQRYENPFRTTITHEFGHVRFHGFLYELTARQEVLLGTGLTEKPNICRRSQIQLSTDYDWMEWQARYSSGAFLMPKRAVQSLICTLRARWGFTNTAINVDTIEGQTSIGGMSGHFTVSEDAARVRLVQLGYIERTATGPALGDA